MNMIFKRKLPIPKDIKEMYPLSEDAKAIKKAKDEELKNILSGKENKLILVIGPCSADNEEAVIDYVSRLKELNDKVKDEIFIIPRIYTNKPRTTGEGYKGMLHQPDPTSSPDILQGLIAIRRLHARVLSEYGFICADEMLYPENHRYLSDVLGYVAVGARSVEDQGHRLTASGLNIPCGMKNPTSGDLKIMINAIHTAQNPHTFIYRGWEVETVGNEYCHAILRGYVDKDGQSIPNYRYDDLLRLVDLYKEANLKNPSIIIDCNHSNSNKHYEQQIGIAMDVMHSMSINKDINELVKGLMIESYIEDGNQSVNEGVYGKSITDGCIGWEKTEKIINELYLLRHKDK